MPQSHLPARRLGSSSKPDKDVQAILALQPQRKAVLFIHGFSGDALGTWSDFPVLMPGRASCAGRDLFFYGYDGLRTLRLAPHCSEISSIDSLVERR